LIKKLIKKGALKKPTLKLYTQHNNDSTIYRGDPAFNNHQSWYDWTFIDGCKRQVPVQILLFLDLRQSFLKKFEFGGRVIDSPGVYAFSRIIEERRMQKAHQVSKLVEFGYFKNKENKPDEPIYTLINTELFVEPCISVPYNHENTTADSTCWLFLLPRDRWYNILISHLRETIKQN
jgi:hypothetical protein